MPDHLLFVHGWATDGWVWEDSARALSRKTRFLNIDLPGHGGPARWDEPTLRPAVRAITEAVKGGCVGIGWSLGAQALMASAIEGIEFKALILAGATPCFVARDGFPWGQSRALVKRMLTDMRKDPGAAVDRFYGLNFTQQELAGTKAREFVKRYGYPGPIDCAGEVPGCAPRFRYDEITNALASLYATDLRDGLEKISCPALIVHGMEDAVCPAGAGRYLSETLKGARFHPIENAGHAPFLTAPERFISAAREFMAGL